MRPSRIAAWVLALLCAGIAAFSTIATAQTGHPVKGSWVGYWGPSDKDQRRFVVDMDWKNPDIVAVINPGAKAVTVKRATLDYDTWTLVLEAEMPDKGGKPARWVATGKLENLGSWQNRVYKGTYQHGGESGKFAIALH